VKENGRVKLKDIYGPGIIKKTKSEATMVCTSGINTCIRRSSHNLECRLVSGLEMG